MNSRSELAGEVGRDIHRAAVDLRPTALDDLGLREALATLLVRA
jgi:two-component system sensor histidine kinase UhpB